MWKQYSVGDGVPELHRKKQLWRGSDGGCGRSPRTGTTQIFHPCNVEWGQVAGQWVGTSCCSDYECPAGGQQSGYVGISGYTCKKGCSCACEECLVHTNFKLKHRFPPLERVWSHGRISAKKNAKTWNSGICLLNSFKEMDPDIFKWF